jgi:hypothetical protein
MLPCAVSTCVSKVVNNLEEQLRLNCDNGHRSGRQHEACMSPTTHTVRTTDKDDAPTTLSPQIASVLYAVSC